jgi:hypothetical protein
MATLEELRQKLKQEHDASEELRSKVLSDRLARIPVTRVYAAAAPAERATFDTVFAFFAKGCDELSADQLVESAAELLITVAPDAAAKVMAAAGPKCAVADFAEVWRNSSISTVVLLRAAYTVYIVKKRRETASAVTPPKWSPGVDIESAITIGTVDDAFEPKAAISFVAAPSDKAQLLATVEECLAKSKVPLPKAEQDPSFLANNVVAVSTVRLPILADADAEDVDDAVELFTAITEEFDQDDAKASLRIWIEGEVGEPRSIVIATLLLVVGASEDAPGDSMDPTHKLRRMLELIQLRHGVEGRLFDDVSFCLEVGAAAAPYFAADVSSKPMLGLLDNARLLLSVKASEACLDIQDALAFDAMMPKPLSGEDQQRFDRRFPATVLRSMACHTVRHVRSRAAFASPLGALEAMMQQIVDGPIEQAVAAGLPQAELAGVVGDSDKLASHLKATLSRAAPWDMHAKHLLGIGHLAKLFGTVKQPPRVAVVGPRGSGKSWLLHCLAFPDAATVLDADPVLAGDENTAFTTTNVALGGQQFVAFDVRTEKSIMVLGSGILCVVICVDSSTEDTAKAGVAFLKAFWEQLPLAAGDAYRVLVVATHQDVAGALPLEKVKEMVLAECEDAAGFDFDVSALKCSDAALPTNFSGIIEHAKKVGNDGNTGAGSDSSDDGDDSGDDRNEGPKQIAESLTFAFRKIVDAISDVTLTNGIADAHVAFDGLPLLSIIPASSEAMTTQRVEAATTVRGNRRTGKLMEFGVPLKAGKTKRGGRPGIHMTSAGSSESSTSDGDADMNDDDDDDDDESNGGSASSNDGW